MESSSSSSSSSNIRSMPNSNNGPTGEAKPAFHPNKKSGFQENIRQKMVSLSNVLKRHENYVIHAVLVGVFVSLGVRALDRQHQIDGLEEERASLEKENKALKKGMWNLKEGLLQEAAHQNDHNLISRLRALFGESAIEESKPDSSASNSKFVV